MSTVLVTFVIVREIVRPVIVRKLGLWCDPYPLPLDHSVRAPDPKPGFCFNRRSLNLIWTNCNSVKTFNYLVFFQRLEDETFRKFQRCTVLMFGPSVVFQKVVLLFCLNLYQFGSNHVTEILKQFFPEWVAYTFLEFRKIPDIIPVCLSLGHGVLRVHCTSDSVQSLSTCVTKR